MHLQNRTTKASRKAASNAGTSDIEGSYFSDGGSRRSCRFLQATSVTKARRSTQHTAAVQSTPEQKGTTSLRLASQTPQKRKRVDESSTPMEPQHTGERQKTAPRLASEADLLDPNTGFCDCRRRHVGKRACSKSLKLQLAVVRAMLHAREGWFKKALDEMKCQLIDIQKTNSMAASAPEIQKLAEKQTAAVQSSPPRPHGVPLLATKLEETSADVDVKSQMDIGSARAGTFLQTKDEH